MAAQGLVVLPGNERITSQSPRELLPKLTCGATGESVMAFEEIVPPGTRSTFHLHHDSDEVAYVLSGEVVFKIGEQTTVATAGSWAFMPRGVPHCWKYTGAETGRILFLYTPAKAGGLIEEQQRTSRAFAS
ncbi:MAG TPA: cupin domain-containing protein, partial [Methylomirabilota bacterium]|nr:cupin domain-containing protein [Methylomirabilota bacterium]